MFGEMRAALNISKGTDILDHIYALPTPEEQQAGMEAIRSIERTAMTNQVAQPGLAALMAYLDDRGVRKGICTRNFDAPVAHLLAKFLPAHVFAPIITRDFRPPKPDPAGILHIARSWGLTRRLGQSGSGTQEAREAEMRLEKLESDAQSKEGALEEADASGLIMVGDSIDDMTAGRRAGAATVLLVNPVNAHLAEHEHTDLTISRLDELIGVLEEGFQGRNVG
jgi:phosphoglycolate phosphatase-like HAD superfamily hydrolase